MPGRHIQAFLKPADSPIEYQDGRAPSVRMHVRGAPPGSARAMQTPTKAKSPEPGAVGTIEQRRDRRVRYPQPARIRPSDPNDVDFSEIRMTANASRGGIYFETERPEYYKGLRLLVTYPNSEVPDQFSVTYLAEVVRVDNRGEGKKGIALKFVRDIKLKVEKTGIQPPRK